MQNRKIKVLVLSDPTGSRAIINYPYTCIVSYKVFSGKNNELTIEIKKNKDGNEITDVYNLEAWNHEIIEDDISKYV